MLARFASETANSIDQTDSLIIPETKILAKNCKIL